MPKLLITILVLLLAGTCFAQKQKVMVMEIKTGLDQMIDVRTKRYVDLALTYAMDTKAEIVVIEMDTYGGEVGAAKEIVDRIMSFEKPVWVFINSDAASAGALISIACDSIYMTHGASIGAATVVVETGEKAPDKYQSYMRGIMRSTAEANGRDPRIAEAMVDEDIEIEGVTKKGEVITFTTSEANKHGFCEAEVSSIEEILKRNSVNNYELDRFHLSSTDRIIQFFINPFISGLLILAIIGGIYFEMQTPGVGFPGAIALAALILYLVPYYLNGLADNWEIIALFIGLALLGVEIFVIPGFGIAGISGIALIVISMILIMLNNDAFDFEFVPMYRIVYATGAAVGGIAGGILLLVFVAPRFTKTRFFSRVALTDTQERTQGYVSTFNTQPMKGKRGVAYTVLRPSGKIMIDNVLYDAYTRGEYIEKDTQVVVVSDEGTSLQVKAFSE